MSEIQRDQNPTVLETHEDKRRVRAVDEVTLTEPCEIVKLQAGDVLHTRMKTGYKQYVIMEVSSTVSDATGLHLRTFDTEREEQRTIHLALVRKWLSNHRDVSITGVRRKVYSEVRGIDYDEDYER